MTSAAPDTLESAKAAGLRYVNEDERGIRRWRHGKGFAYVDAAGKRVRDARTLQRIRSLVIPPAWTDVWICSTDRGHIQATGRDAKGRKQYRYHPEWRAVRDENKFDRTIAFGEALPVIRSRVAEHLALPGLPLEKVLGAVVWLLDHTLIRVGNDEYARKNHSYGLTTLRNDHVDVRGARMRFHFRGKSGKEHLIEIEDPKLAKIVRRCQDLPGHHLFHYVDPEGQPRVVESGDVNDYLRTIAQCDFTAKDFRTWAGTVLAASALARCPPCASGTAAKRQLVGAVRSVAKRLGNTPAVCRKSYVHPAVMETFLRQPTRPLLRRASAIKGLQADEARVLAFLRRERKGAGRRSAAA